ncbi:helix-turn-helix domain-containing protein [Nocardia iowensis]|uniref:AraC family transcriptional regulator n=1 Tax=Nocardia iowensis TaxID=204891 RepID=A0ABX8RIN9_NOCIO|nr:AraC family transcriptional regulator [Nocardia iowensis]QXN89500.1 AraC family transcriptional regulator [Nocardia iowensis]
MIEEPRSWRLEQNGNAVFAASCGEFACYAENTGQPDASHRHPAWELVLSWDGPLRATDEHGKVITAPGVLIPPGTLNTTRQPSGFTSLWIDPYCLALPGRARILPLDLVQVRRLLAATTGDFDSARLRHTVHQVLDGSTQFIDPRLRQALDMLDDGTGIAELADRVGLSPRRLRQLAARDLGGTLPKLRRWHRLREAGLLLPFYPAAEVAARTGFADQAHLIRTMSAFTGRTPSSTPIA